MGVKGLRKIILDLHFEKNKSGFGEEGVEQVWRQREARKEGGAVIREEKLGVGPMRW